MPYNVHATAKVVIIEEIFLLIYVNYFVMNLWRGILHRETAAIVCDYVGTSGAARTTPMSFDA